ncbi:MAG: alpha/beta hydrolase [Pseudomonadota bacterium]
MPLLRVAVVGREARLHKSTASLGPTLRRALAGDGPVMILIHGFKFDPTIQGRDPHRHIFGYAPKGDFKAVSWPRQLGFGRGNANEGLCIAFGWAARGWFWDVYREAALAGAALAGMVARIRRLAPDRPVHILAHSLGARVALAALPHLGPGDIARMILLGGCEFESRAARMLDTGAGRSAEVINVTSRENDFYEFMFERLIRPDHWRDRGIGPGLRGGRPNWADLQIDHPEAQRALASLGFPIKDERFRVCHWSTYNRRGLMPFYAALLRQPRALPLAVLRAHLPEQEPRYRQFLALPDLPPVLPSRIRRPS